MLGSRRQVMNDGQNRFPRGKCLQKSIKTLPSLRIEGGGRFVKKKNIGIAEQFTNQGQAKTFSPGEIFSPFGHRRV